MDESLGKAIVEIRADLGKLARDLAGARSLVAKAASSAGNALKNSFMGAIRGLGAAIAGLMKTVTSALGTAARMARNVFAGIEGAAVAALAVGVKEAIKFETSMSRIVGLVGLSKDEVAGFASEITKLSAATGRGPNELAEALYFVTSAGFAGKQAMDILTASAKAAAAGLGETQSIADLTTSALAAYGSENLSASQAVAILVAAVREGKVEASELAPVLGRIIPIASELGVSFDQVAAGVAALSRTGLDAAEGATALRGVLSNILRPSQQGKEALEAVGLSAEGLRQQLKEKGLLSVLRTLQTTFGDNQEAMSLVFDDVRALTGVLSLVGENASEVETIFAKLAATTTNDLDKAFDAFEETSASRLQKAKARIQAGLMDIGATVLPIIADLFDQLQPVIIALAANGADLVRTLAPILAAIAPIVVDIVGVLGQALKAAAPLAQLLLGAFAQALQWIAQGLATVMPLLVALIPVIREGLTAAAAFLLPILSELAKVFMEHVLPAVRPLIPILASVAGMILEGLGAALGILLTAISDVLPYLGPLIEAIGMLLTAALATVAPVLSELITTLIPVLATVLTDVIHALRTSGLLDAFAELLTTLLPLLPALVQLAADVLIPLLPALVDILTVFADMMNALIAPEGAIGLVDILGGLGDALGALAEAAAGAIDWLAEMWNKIPKPLRSGLFGGLIPGIGASLGAGKAAGGKVNVGTLYPVNEYGVELFAPSVPGEVIPNGAAGMGGGRGGDTYIIEGSVISERDLESIMRRISQERDRTSGTRR